MPETRRQHGLTLLEILMVLAILSILSATGIGIFYGSVQSQKLDSTADMIISDLRLARTKAMLGEDGKNWGIHFINDSDDYYQLFSSPTGYEDASVSIDATVYLSGGISFSAPLASSSAVFNKITGVLSATESVTIVSPYNESKTITSTPFGHIY